MSSSIHPIRQYAAVSGVTIHLVTANENADLAIQAAQRYWGMSWDLLSKQLGMRIEPIITYVPEPGSAIRPDDAEMLMKMTNAVLDIAITETSDQPSPSPTPSLTPTQEPS